MKPLRHVLAFLPLVVACGGQAADAPPVADAPPPPLLSAPDQFYARNGVKLRYRETGRGDPVILVHGYAGRLELMAELSDSLRGQFRVIALDIRGFGASDTPDSANSYGRAMADDVIGLMDHLGIQRAHLVGHSMGALIAANVAARYPDRAASVGLIAGPLYPDSVAMAAATRQWVVALRQGKGLAGFIRWIFPGIPDSVATGVSTEIMRSNDSLALIDAMAAMGGLTVDTGARHRVRAPALVAVGSLDPLVPFSRTVAGWWPGARLLEVEGADHLNILVRPEVIAGIRALTGGR